jgi:hypothetical protein
MCEDETRSATGGSKQRAAKRSGKRAKFPICRGIVRRGRRGEGGGRYEGGVVLQHGGDAFATGFAGVRESSQLAAGQVMGRRYRLVQMLGRGGMGLRRGGGRLQKR